MAGRGTICQLMSPLRYCSKNTIPQISSLMSNPDWWTPGYLIFCGKGTKERRWQQGQLGVSINGISPIAGWFIRENPIYKWMMTRGTPMTQETSNSWHYESLPRWVSVVSPPRFSAISNQRCPENHIIWGVPKSWGYLKMVGLSRKSHRNRWFGRTPILGNLHLSLQWNPGSWRHLGGFSHHVEPRLRGGFRSPCCGFLGRWRWKTRRGRAVFWKTCPG